jgi:hypothetical protein
MLKLRGLVWAAAVAAGMAVSSLAMGQDEAPARGPAAKSPRGTPAPGLPPAREEPPAPDFTLSVDFPGGTVGQYIEALKKAAGGHAVNVVASRAAMEVTIAAVSLRDVSVFAALSAVQGAAGRDSQWNVRGLGLSNSKAEAWSLEFLPPPARYASQNDTALQVFSLRDLTEPLPGDPPGAPLTKPPEVVLTAVRAALDLLADRSPQPEMKFHEDSGLLIIHGTMEQIAAVHQALDQMREDVKRRREAVKASMGPRADLGQWKADLQKAEVAVAETSAQLDQQTAALERARQRQAAGQESADEMGEAAAKVERAKADAMRAKIDVERARAVLEQASRAASGDEGKDQMQARLEALRNAEARLAMEADKATAAGQPEKAAMLRRQQESLATQRDQIQIDIDTAQRLEQIMRAKQNERDRAPQGRTEAIYDLPPMDPKAREQLVSAIRGLEAAINNPERLHIQSIQGEGKLIIEADAAMHAVVRGMVKEVAGERGVRNEAPEKGGRPGGR